MELLWDGKQRIGFLCHRTKGSDHVLFRCFISFNCGFLIVVLGSCNFGKNTLFGNLLGTLCMWVFFLSQQLYSQTKHDRYELMLCPFLSVHIVIWLWTQSTSAIGENISWQRWNDHFWNQSVADRQRDVGERDTGYNASVVGTIPWLIWSAVYWALEDALQRFRSVWNFDSLRWHFLFSL
jgi:hypothetical protein